MNIIDAQNLLLSTTQNAGTTALAIFTAVIGLGVAVLVLKFGMHKLLHDQSLQIMGMYVREVPYKGYNRWRSRKWNMKNTI